MCGQYKYYHNYREYHMGVLNKYDITTIVHQYSAVYGRNYMLYNCDDTILTCRKYTHIGLYNIMIIITLLS